MAAINQFAPYIGLDWVDKKHDVCVLFKKHERVLHMIEHNVEALDIWLTELHQKVKGRVAIALELKKGPGTTKRNTCWHWKRESRPY